VLVSAVAELAGAGKTTLAIAAAHAADAIWRETGDRHREAAARNNLGLAVQGIRRLGEAITAH
jgi:cytidylate kinase